MSTVKCLAVMLVTLNLCLVGSRPVSAQSQGEILSFTQRLSRFALSPHHTQPRGVLYKCQLSRLPYGNTVPQVIRHLPVVNLGCVWNDEGNTAYRYSSQGSNYRQYRPTISTTLNGGSLITFKVDHIRGWALDDYGIVRIQLDQFGRIVSESCDINIRGRGSFSTGEIINIVPTFRSYTPVFASRLKSGANHLFDKPGRVNFPNEIEHYAISVVNSTVLCSGCHSH